MKKSLSIIVAIVIALTSVFAIVVSAASGTSGAVSWSYDDSTHTLSITGSGKMADYYYNLYAGTNPPWFAYVDTKDPMKSFSASEIEKVEIADGVTYIGRYAFNSLTALTEVKIPAECEVGPHAFEGCTALESVTFGKDCKGIGDYAFVGCSALETVTFGDQSVSFDIGTSAFEGCVSLKKIDLPFYTASIGDRAFAYCYALESVTFGADVVSGTVYDLGYVGDGAFRNCTSLTEFAFPTETNGSSLELGDDIFNYCTALETVTIPEQSGISEIGDGMFRNCEALLALTVETEIDRVGEYAFQDCASLETLDLPATYTEIGRYAFRDSGLVKFTIPDGVKVIPEGAFLDCADLTTVTGASKIEYILDYAFQNCAKLKLAPYCSDLIGIGEGAFYGCEALEAYTVPASAQYIRDYAFARSGVKDLYIRSSNTTFGTGVIGIKADVNGASVDETVKIHASDKSFAHIYAEKLGLAFSADYADVTPNVELQYYLDKAEGKDLSGYEKIYIGGVPLSEFDVVYQNTELTPKSDKTSKPLNQVRKTIVEGIFDGVFGYSGDDEIEAVKLSNHGDSTKSHHIYLINNAIDNDKIVGLASTPFADLECIKRNDDCDQAYFVKYGAEGYEYLVKNGNLYIFAGLQRGASYAMTDIVEKFLGITYLYEREYVVNAKEIINIENGTYNFKMPIISDRDSRSYSYDTESSCTYTYDDGDVGGATVPLRINSIKHEYIEKNDKSGYGVGYFGSSHSFGDLIDTPNTEQPCFTDQQTFFDVLHACFDELYDNEWNEKWWYYENVAIAVSQMDNANYDAKDIAYAKANGLNMADVITSFNNRIVDGLDLGHYYYSEPFEGAKVWSLAYMDARTAPLKTIPRANLEICLAYYGCQNHPITSDDCKYSTYFTDNKTERANLEKWAALTENMYVWYYPVSYTFQMAPMPVLFNMREDVRYFADNNIYGVYFENQYGEETIGDGYSYEMLTAYMQARLMWNPYMTEEQFMDYVNEFIGYYYGSDTEDVLEVIKLDNAAGDANSCFVNQFDWPFDTFNYEYMGEHYGEMMALIDNALAAKDLTSEQKEHLDKLSSHILFLGLSAAHDAEYVNGTPDQQAAYKAAYDRLISILNTYAIDIGYGKTAPTSANYDETPYSWYGLPDLHRVAYYAREIEIILDGYTDETVKASDLEALLALMPQNAALYKNAAQFPALEDEVIAVLDANKEKIEHLIDVLGNLDDKVDSLEDESEKYTYDDVKSSDKPAIEKAISDIDALIGSGALNPDQESKLTAAKGILCGMLGKIADTDAKREQCMEKAAAIDLATVTSDSLDELIDLASKMEDMISHDNLTFEERIAFNNAYQNVIDAIDTVGIASSTAAEVEYYFYKRYTPETVTIKAYDLIEMMMNRIAAVIASDNTSLSEYGGLMRIYNRGAYLLECIDKKEAAKSSSTAMFSDVKSSDWFVDDVKYVYDNHLMDGVGDGKFDPKGTTTRAMVVTVLYRLSGSPAVNAKASFTDVEAGKWYTDAVAWAEANGIVNGYGDGRFGTNDPMTREQLAAVLYRFTAKAGKDTRKSGDLAGYSDTASIDDYALDAFRWATANGIMQGRDNHDLDPLGFAQRSELAAVLHRYCNVIYCR